MKTSRRFNTLPPYIFTELQEVRKKAEENGKDIIDLSVGDPDFIPASNIIDAFEDSLRYPDNHRYSLGKGIYQLRKRLAEWYKQMYDVSIHAEELHILNGAKEGISHIPLIFINPNDVAIIPNPGYPVYASAVLLAEGTPYFLPHLSENSFMPDLRSIPSEIVAQTKILFLNFPNNPTGAIANDYFLSEAVYFCRKNNILLCYDNVYSLLSFDGRPKSIFQYSKSTNGIVEFNSFSKMYSMSGWRIGWIAGDRKIVTSLTNLMSHLNDGTFKAIQSAAMMALDNEEIINEGLSQYKDRADLFVSGLRNAGISVTMPKAGFYIWASVLGEMTSMEFCKHLLEETGVVACPGNAFGTHGEGWVRYALTKDKDILMKAVKRIKKMVDKI